MTQRTCDTIDTLLATVQEEIDDQELEFKLRTARQLLMVCDEQTETYRKTLEEANLDEDTRQRLVKLGYL